MGDHGHGHGHNPNLAHHFESMDQQVNAAKLGMWLFLSTEVLLFAGLFCAYAFYRATHPEVFAYASTFLDIKWGAINTVVLLLSSFTVALAVRSSQLGERSQTSMYLVLTLVGAVAFMGIKSIEYSHKFHEHLTWGLTYTPQSALEIGYDPAKHGGHGAPAGEQHGAPADGEHAAPVDPALQALLEPEVKARTPWDGEDLLAQNTTMVAPPAAHPAGLKAPAPAGHAATDAAAEERVRNVWVFFGIYFVMTGTHGLHVIFGGLAILWVLRRNMRGDFSKDYNVPVDLVGLYWHLVDLIWIFLFPLLYLINVAHQGKYV